ncbi:hypothetical protein VMCG_04930 [Cytospora schulzeri]|uniref:FAD-binding domain-containing protein n=1 Tax=Cytospora schulzeri TaxID=448051 RepID=A0A423WN07_9PEZI|nr:hypothetical protein VMCG_04930 [Valsa malicola]
MPSQPRIAIVGGGPGGLTLGLLLHKHGIPATIYELRQKPTEQEIAKPSGMLDLHEGSGLAVIKEIGLFDDFIPLTGDCVEAMWLSDKNGHIVFQEKEYHKGYRPEVSRHALNQLLINNLPLEAIKWDHKLISATSTTTTDGHTETELNFGTHGKQKFDLVLGADGAWSRVRKLLTDDKPYYAGKQVITLTIKNISDKYPHLAKLVGPGTFAALEGGYGVIAQHGSSDSSRIYIMLTLDEEDFATTSGLAGLPPTAAKDKLLSSEPMLGSWGAPIKELVAAGCDEEAADNPSATLDIRALYTHPVGFTWEHKPGMTLIGDAAHLMLPSGEGVNIAMLDALLLSRAIIKAFETTAVNKGDPSSSFRGTCDTFLREYEVDLALRAKEAAEHAIYINDIMYGEDGAEALAKVLQGFSGR